MNNSNVYIAGLPRDINEQSLRELFMNYGDIVSVRIMPGRTAHQSNFAFVKFNSEAEAQAAIHNVNGKPMHDGGRLIVKMADKELQAGGAPRDTHSQTNIHISGLPLDMDEETFRMLFVEFGPIKSVKMALEPRIKKKYGFINFFDSLCATAALKKMHKRMYNGHELYVKYAVFTEKSPPPPNMMMQHYASLAYPASAPVQQQPSFAPVATSSRSSGWDSAAPPAVPAIIRSNGSVPAIIKPNSNREQAGMPTLGQALPVGPVLPVGPIRKDPSTQRSEPYGTPAPAPMSMGGMGGGSLSELLGTVAPVSTSTAGVASGAFSSGGLGNPAPMSNRNAGLGDLL